jgi:hypothetical protein
MGINDIPVIRVFNHDNIPPCLCGRSDFFTITCDGGNKFLWQNANKSEGSGIPPMVQGLIYSSSILSITVCIHCKTLQGFIEFPK